MKYYTVLIVAVIVIAGLGLFVYYENENNHKTVTGSHVYLGAVYGGQTQLTNYVSASVYFGNGINLKDNIYYIVLSIWDSNYSYDQIGISSLYGKFYCTYSYTEMVNGSIKYVFDPHWVQIVPGQHEMSMYVYNGNVVFRFDNNNYTAYTGGNNFAIETNEKVGNHSFSGLTIYEEIYGFNKSLPGISFNFSNIEFGTTGYPTGSISDWIQFSHNLTDNFTSVVFMKSNSVNIYNSVPYTLVLTVKNLVSPAYFMVSDINVTLPGSGQYTFNLLPGNYTLYLIYGGQVKTYKVAIDSDVHYTITL
jgi:hypothetical protein